MLELTHRRILRFWLPLASTWLMMAFEGPFLAAIIARLPAPVENLAAFGVAFAVAVIIESPVIMLLSASTALVSNGATFLALRRFVYSLNSVLTLCMLALLLQPVSHSLLIGALGLPDSVARLTSRALLLLVPWPAAIGYRRFYQGVLIRHGRPKWVAYGTIFRLSSMSAAALLASKLTDFTGVEVGALALSAGVVVEAAISRWISRDVVRDLVKAAREHSRDEAPSLGRILAFYLPLALTSVLGMAVQPVITFFMGHSRHPLESLAVLPVINGVTFIFRSLGLAYHEVAVAFLTEADEHYVALRQFALFLGILTSGGLAVIAFTPVSDLWFERLSGLSPELARLALLPTRILVLLPALTVLLSFERALLVHARRTTPVTGSTLVEVGTIAVVLVVGIYQLRLIGAVAAALALVIGRLCGTLTLLKPCAAPKADRDVRPTTFAQDYDGPPTSLR